MNLETKYFESRFGFSMPKKLMDFYRQINEKGKLPSVFKINNANFDLGIQHLLSISDSENYDIENKRLSFAVTTDGFNLIVDLKDASLQVLQDEYGDVDSLGITIGDIEV